MLSHLGSQTEILSLYFEAELFVEPHVVDDGPSPFIIVISDVIGRLGAPVAASEAVVNFEYRSRAPVCHARVLAQQVTDKWFT